MHIVAARVHDGHRVPVLIRGPDLAGIGQASHLLDRQCIHIGAQHDGRPFAVLGPDFAKALFQLEPGAWRGPIRSGYGWHLVFVDATEPGRIPAFEEVEPDVKSAWLDQKQREIKHTAFGAMRARYTVVVPPIEATDLTDLRIPQAAIASSNLVPQ
jgi:parvulin-like peptidyl-prolyl cis-trans isomerase-like protein